MAGKKAKKHKAKKPIKKPKAEKKPAVVEAAYEETTFKCSSCGRQVTMIKVPGLDVSSFLCQRCQKGEGFDEGDED